MSSVPTKSTIPVILNPILYTIAPSEAKIVFSEIVGNGRGRFGFFASWKNYVTPLTLFVIVLVRYIKSQNFWTSKCIQDFGWLLQYKSDHKHFLNIFFAMQTYLLDYLFDFDLNPTRDPDVARGCSSLHGSS